MWAVLTSALRARSPAPRMAISASPPPTIAEYPSPALSPWDVVASQISALQAEDSAPTLRIPVATTLAPARTPRAHGVPCRGRCAHLPLRIARVQAHDGKDEAHVGASGAPVPAPSRPRRAPVAPPSRPRRAPVAGVTQLLTWQSAVRTRRHGEPALSCVAGSAVRVSPSLPSPTGAHLLRAALLRAAHVPRHAHLRAGGRVRTLLRACLGSARGGGGRVAAEALHV